jgi:hypothetical protein
VYNVSLFDGEKMMKSKLKFLLDVIENVVLLQILIIMVSFAVRQTWHTPSLLGVLELFLVAFVFALIKPVVVKARAKLGSKKRD